MWEQSKSHYRQMPRPGGLPGHEPEALPDMPARADMTDISGIAESDVLESLQPLLEDLPPGTDVTSVQWQRAHIRQLLREFLRAVPRSEPEATLAIVRLDGSTRIFTRAELSGAIDRLRPRMRQILRLALEERWSRQRVCDYLKGISIKTFERDQVEGLDILANL